jgi:hypothetical protein
VSSPAVERNGRPARDAAVLKAEVRRWAARIGVTPRRVQVQRMTTKWASCSSAGRICLSRDLLREDRAFQDVVIVHELLHLFVPNHGKLFRGLITAYVPAWEQVSRTRASRVCGHGSASSRS